MERSTTRLNTSLSGLLLLTLLCCMPAYADGFRARLNQVDGQKTQSADIIAEIRFGRSVAARILGRENLYHDDALTHYVNLVGNALALHSSRNELDYHFAILDKAYANAYSTPGGYIFITRGAIDMAQDEAELAAILAHEVAHVTLRHIVKALNIRGADQSNLSGLTALLGAVGDTTRVALNQTVDKAMSILFATGFNVKEELEADQTAALLLAETGYDPTALKRYLKRLTARTKETHSRETQTHPPSSQRIQALDSLYAAEGLDKLSFPIVKTRFNEMTGRTP